MSRTRNSVKNAVVGTLGQVAQVLLQFLCRFVFIFALSKEYLGVSGLFSNVLSVLSFAELGFGTALIYSLYQPIHENDVGKIIKLLNLYKKIYRVIALIITLAGLLLLPFLRYLIKDYDSYSRLTSLPLIYLLFLLNTVVSYLYIYKKSLLDAYQKNYMYVIIQKAMIVLQNIMQIVYILFSHDFIGYLVIQVIITIATNLVISHKADKVFPYLSTKSTELPAEETKKSIYKNTAAMSMHKFGAVVVNGTDNLILSSMVSLSSVALNSNYCLIITNINAFIELVFKSVTASVGDLGATGDQNKLISIFDTLEFMSFWVYGLASVCLYVIINPFIEVWIGLDFVFDGLTTAILIFNFYLKGMRVVINIYRDSLGLFWYDRYKPIFEALVNLVASIVLAKYMGIAGVFIGTALSTLLVCFWVEPYILYHHVFKHGLGMYFLKYFEYFVFTLLICGGVKYIASMLPVHIGFIVLEAIIAFAVFHIALFVVFHNTDEMKSTIIFLKRLIKRE